MAYEQQRVDQIAQVLRQMNVAFYEKKMFAGVCFMVDDKMFCGTHTDKKTGENLLLCRVGEDKYEEALNKKGSIPMNFTGKPMKGYVFVTEEGYQSPKDLKYWLQLCLDYNPLAKKSKK
jgi:TfoX N-terminal domain